MPFSLGSILKEMLKPVTDIVSEVVVDKDKVREIQLEMELIADKADERYHNEVMAQIEVNKEEAKHPSIFVAGWRPAVGWVGAAGLALVSVILPLGSWVATVLFGYEGTFPQIDGELLLTMLGGILGIGGYRSFDKLKKTDVLKVGSK